MNEFTDDLNDLPDAPDERRPPAATPAPAPAPPLRGQLAQQLGVRLHPRATPSLSDLRRAGVEQLAALRGY